MFILKKKQILAVVLAIMLLIAGYINYSGDTVEVSGEITDSPAEAEYVVNLKNDLATIEPKDDAKISDAYFVSARLEKEETYEKQMDIHKEIIYDEKTDEKVKTEAQTNLNKIVDKISKEMTIEKLIEAKGFNDVLAIINEDNINVIVKTPEELSVAQVAQIQNIVMREANSDAEDIHIVTKR